MPGLVSGPLAIGGTLLVASGLGGVALGTFAAGWLRGLLPELEVDAAAVGGAAVAIGVAVMGLGLAHFVALYGLRRGLGWARSAATLLAATLAMVTGISAVAAAVTLARGTELLLPLGGGAVVLVAASVAYGAAVVGLVRTGRDPTGRGSGPGRAPEGSGRL